MPTRRPTISESARLVSSVTRAAAASVSFMTCGRGRGFGLEAGAFEAGVFEAGIIPVMWLIPAAIQCRLFSIEEVKSQVHSFNLTRFLHANRYPLRSKTLCIFTTYSARGAPRHSSGPATTPAPRPD